MKFILKKSWRSPRGKLYPKGTVFKRILKDDLCQNFDISWYNFNIPFREHGFVLFKNSIFKKQTDIERKIQKKNQKKSLEHIRASEPYDINLTERILTAKKLVNELLEESYISTTEFSSTSSRLIRLIETLNLIELDLDLKKNE